MEERVVYLMIRKLSNEASPEELAELERFQSSTPDQYSQLSLIEEIWNQQQQETSEDNIDLSYQHHIARYQLQFPGTPIKLWYQNYWFRAACILLVMVGILTYLFYPIRTNELMKLPASVLTARKTQKKIILPDGTSVWLNGGSTLKYDFDMNKADTRQVYLSGEAFFDVVKDKAHPFIISTSKISIRVFGTAFNVKAIPEKIKQKQHY